MRGGICGGNVNLVQLHNQGKASRVSVCMITRVGILFLKIYEFITIEYLIDKSFCTFFVKLYN